MKARIVIGANYGDEGKGTVVATYTKTGGHVLNVLTNGGAQRGHSILTEAGSMSFHHFGSGTYHGADSYYSRFFILNPMQFVQEYESLIVKPRVIYRDENCLWTTPYDSMANLISEQQKGRHASCCMGIWNTIKRTKDMGFMPFDWFVSDENRVNPTGQEIYLRKVKKYYEDSMEIPENFRSVWDSPVLVQHFINDCIFMREHTTSQKENVLLSNTGYDEVIFENGQGLLLCDTGRDTYDTTPSNTGILYSLKLLEGVNVESVTAHYVTRPYLTRHGDGHIQLGTERKFLSSGVAEDRTNRTNEFQGKFRYGILDIPTLKERVAEDARGVKFELEVTHCDEMDRVEEFKKLFNKVNTYDSPLIK